MALHTVKQILNADFVEKLYIETSNHQKVEGILSEYRLDRENETEGKFIYDIRHADEDWCEPASIEDHVLVNWFGCLIVDTPIQFPDEPFLEITDYSFDNQ